jgi:hypothetical protein
MSTQCDRPYENYTALESFAGFIRFITVGHFFFYPSLKPAR